MYRVLMVHGKKNDIVNAAIQHQPAYIEIKDELIPVPPPDGPKVG